MRFAVATADRHLDVFLTFLDAGWRAQKLFTAPVDNVVDHNQASIRCARDLGIPVQLSPLSESDLAELQRQGCDALIVATYNWRIPDWQPYLSYAFNFHPSPLPVGRGPCPLHRAILEGHTDWGVSCHKIAKEYDSGDILAQHSFTLDDNTCYDSLSLRVQIATRQLAQHVAATLPALWHTARPQPKADFWNKPEPQDWLLDFSHDVDTVLRRVRAFGSLECLLELDHGIVHVRRACGWKEAHTDVPGTVVYRNLRKLVFAARDGYVAILEWSPVARSQIGLLGRN